MKLIFKVILPSVIIFLFSTTLVLSTSGCCSGHRGVNCSAGAQANGNVICNDGNRNSSCSYSSMVECGGNNQPVYVVPTPTYNPTPQPTAVFNPTLIPTIQPTASPEVKGVETEAPVAISPILKPTATPQELVAGNTSSSGLSSIIAIGIVGIIGWWFWRRKKRI